MQTLESALKCHLAQAIDQFLEQLQRTVTLSARLDIASHDPADKKAPMGGLLRPLAEDFSSLATDWRNEQLRSLVSEAEQHLLDLSCCLGERLDRLEARQVDGGSNTKSTRAASNGNGRRC